MEKTVKSAWGAFWCWLNGAHRGNLQWGEQGPDGKTIHKCSKCWKLARRTEPEKKK